MDYFYPMIRQVKSTDNWFMQPKYDIIIDNRSRNLDIIIIP